MPPRRKPALRAQGKPRMLGGSTRPWRVRLYAPDDGGTKYQVMFRVPASEGEPWKQVLRRANSEVEARKIFEHEVVPDFVELVVAVTHLSPAWW